MVGKRRHLRNLELSAAAIFMAASLCAPHAEEVLTLTHQGVTRSAVIYRPATLAAGPSPVVIGLPGRGQDIKTFREWLRLDAAADRNGFLAVFPDAIDKEWSYGRPIIRPMPTVNGETVDDVGFIQNLIANLVDSKRADPTRIYVTGLSRGGLLTYTLACALADRIAAFAPLIAPMTEYQRQECRPTRPIPMMVVAGTDDNDLWYDGALGPLGRLLSVPETMEYWRVWNGCTQQSAKGVPHLNPSDSTRIRLIEWSGCKDGVPLRLYRVNDGGHQVPSFSVNSEDTKKRMGLRNRDIEAADEIWTFVKGIARQL